MDILTELNPEQLRAVKHESGPLLILAGAGSGKTKTLAKSYFGSDVYKQSCQRDEAATGGVAARKSR